jgi:hypothetical protein
MSRYLLPLIAAAACGGCVPVTEPVGDIDKAEPDKNLVGKWKPEDSAHVWIADHPVVKGHPKGLMRLVAVEPGMKPEDAKQENVLWFYTAEVGEHRYVHVLLVQADSFPGLAQVGKAGEYEAWAKNDKRGYGVFRIHVDGDSATLYQVNNQTFEALMNFEKFTAKGGIYQTSVGWLKKHLEKNDPAKFFPEAKKLTRVKQ